MISLEEKRKQMHISLQTLGMAVMSLRINPASDGNITIREAKRLTDWYKGYTEENAI